MAECKSPIETARGRRENDFRVFWLTKYLTSSIVDPMPNTKSAKKALRQSERRRILNVRRKRSLRTALKNFEKTLAAKNKEEALRLYPGIQKALDKSAKNNIIKKNTASRKKSRLAARLKTIS